MAHHSKIEQKIGWIWSIHAKREFMLSQNYLRRKVIFGWQSDDKEEAPPLRRSLFIRHYRSTTPVSFHRLVNFTSVPRHYGANARGR